MLAVEKDCKPASTLLISSLVIKLIITLMATVPYYNRTNVKLDLRITDSSQDTQLDTWGVESENEIDDLIYTEVAKARLLNKLPVLPFTAGSVPQSIRSAANHHVKMQYYSFTRNPDMAKLEDDKWKEKVQTYVAKLDTDSIIYGRIAH